MLTTLQIGPLTLPVYPVAVLLSFWAGLATAARAARMLGIDEDHIYNAGLYGLVAGLVTGRVAHVIAYWPAYRTQPLEIMGLNMGAFLPWPAVAAALAAAAWYIARHRLPWAGLLDACTPGIFITLAILHLGALLTGRAAGAASDLPWAITVWGINRHPIQLYESLWAFAMATLSLSAIAKSARPGTVALLGMLGLGLGMWLFEPFRAESATLPGRFRTAQVIGLALALVALGLVGRRATAQR